MVKLIYSSHFRGMVSDLKIVIGARIRAAREAAGMSREQLAAHVGRTPEALGNIERGVSLPPLDTLGSISEALGVALSEFVKRPSESDSKRAELEMRAYALICKLSDSDIEFATELLEAIQRQAQRRS
jgi:transcriptional regulator with XRE-family HTH domain